MKYQDEYRDPAAVGQLREAIRRATTRPWTIMEICGGQTHTIVKYGLDELLPPEIELVHGPGCPVCVTPLELVDKAIEIAEVFQTTDRKWRGIGTIPESGFRLAPAYAEFDAEQRFSVAGLQVAESKVCISGLILQGLKKPHQCPAFGKMCTPDNPLGATMVSSEGACAAYYHYGRYRDMDAIETKPGSMKPASPAACIRCRWRCTPWIRPRYFAWLGLSGDGCKTCCWSAASRGESLVRKNCPSD